MRRIKRFVLAESTEKDPIWKSSDNLLAGVPKMNVETCQEESPTPVESPANAHLHAPAGLT